MIGKITSHGFVRIAEDSQICAICGGHELDHYWGCEEHNTSGNGAFNCPECCKDGNI